MQSTLSIGSNDYNIDVFEYQQKNTNVLTEKMTVIDPSDYDAGNSVIVANGFHRHNFTIKSKCTYSMRDTYIAAFKAQSKVYPLIYPENGTTSVITEGDYYYIQSINGNLKVSNDYYYFTMQFIRGGGGLDILYDADSKILIDSDSKILLISGG